MNEVVPWFQVGGVLFSIAVVIGGVWLRLHTQITSNKSELEKELAKIQLHIAENFVSKAGHRETMDQVMDAITAVKQAIDGTNLRIDRMWESGSKPTSSRALK